MTMESPVIAAYHTIFRSHQMGRKSSSQSSAFLSLDDDNFQLFGEHHMHSSPLKALKRLGNILKNHSSVTTTEAKPGISSDDQDLDAEVPIAHYTSDDALNAGHKHPLSAQRDNQQTTFSDLQKSSSQSSLCPERNSVSTSPEQTCVTKGLHKGEQAGEHSKSISPNTDGSHTGKSAATPLSKEQLDAQNIAQNPQKRIKKVGQNGSTQDSYGRKTMASGEKAGPQSINTTKFEKSKEQSERQRRVLEHLRESQRINGSSIDYSIMPNDNTTRDNAIKGTSVSVTLNSNPLSGSGDGTLKQRSDLFDTQFHQSRSYDYTDSGNKSAIVGSPTSINSRTSDRPANGQLASSLAPRNRFIGHKTERKGAPNNTENSGNTVGFGNSTDEKANAGGSTANRSSERMNSDYYMANSGHNSENGSLTVTNVDSFEPSDIGNSQTPSAKALDMANTESLKDKQSNQTFENTSNELSEDKGASKTRVCPRDLEEIDQSTKVEDNSMPNQEVEINMPEGGVPGLGVEYDEPLLPGESRDVRNNDKDGKLKEENLGDEKEQNIRNEMFKKPSEDLNSKKANEWEKHNKEAVRRKRLRQAEYSGWRQIGGWDKGSHRNTKEESDDLLQRSTLLESYISDKYLGDWYHNTAIILFTAVFAWLFGRMRFSIQWISIILLVSATSYRTSIRRMRLRYRDDLLRYQLLETHDEEDTESMEWLNSFLIKFWLIYEPSLSQMITEIANEILEEQTPPFIQSIKLNKFTLGTKAPRIDFVRSFPKTNPQVVVIELGLSFTPNDIMDLTAKQLQTKVNPEIQLGIRIGKGIVSKSFPILLKDMSFKGKFRLRLKLIEQFPHVQTVDFSFLSPPQFDFVLKPIGGDTFGFDINIIPGLSKFIKDIVHANLGPIFYAPNAFQLNVEQLMVGVGAFSGVGVLTLRLIGAENLTCDSDGRVDPYIIVKDKSSHNVGYTKIKSNDKNPTWNETIHVIITNTNDNVVLEVLDFDESGPDRMIGQAPVSFSNITDTEITKLPITSGGRTQGYIKYIASYSSVKMPSAYKNQKTITLRDPKSGILSLKIISARNLDPTVSKVARLSPFAEVEFSGQLKDSTKVSRDTNNPEWNYSGEHIVQDKSTTVFTVRIKDNRSSFTESPQIAIFKRKLSQLLIEAEKGRKWFPLGEGMGEIQIEMQWKPVNISISGNVGNYVEPIGIIRLNIKRAKDLRNSEHLGKISPYVRVFVGPLLAARTDWFKNELNPVWDEILYIPIESGLKDLTVEVLDIESRTKDRSLGSFVINLENFVKCDEDDNCQIFVSDTTFVDTFSLPNLGPKGTLEYSIEFYPTIPVVGPQEHKRIQLDRKMAELLQQKIEEAGGDKDKALSTDEKHELEGVMQRLELSGIDMPIEEQLKYDSGIFAVAVVSLKGHRVGQSLRIIANTELFPIYMSPPFKSSKRWSTVECPDFANGQMKLSSVRFEIGTFSAKKGIAGLHTHGEDDEHKLFAVDPDAIELTIPCYQLLTEASLEPKKYTMKNGVEIELECRFLPLPGLIIEPSEHVENMGHIEIDLQKAIGVAAADSTGLSDPYCAFYLDNNSERIYKSKIIKQTLDPVWDESFRFSVDDVKTQFFKVIINDWDMGNTDDFLGGHKFELNELQPLVWKDYRVSLEKVKKNKEVRRKKGYPGILYIRMRFIPSRLIKEGDTYFTGARSVVRTSGGLVNTSHSGDSTPRGAIGIASNSVGNVISSPLSILNKITHRGEKDNKEGYKSYFTTIEEITGLKHVKCEEIQIRCYLFVDSSEKEIYRSNNLKVENGDAIPVNAQFMFKTMPGCELGIKVLTCKSLGRHSDICQISTELKPGTKELKLTEEAIMRITIDKENY